MMKLGYLLRKWGGILLLVGGSFFMLGFLVKFSEGDVDASDWWALMILVIAPFALGSWMYITANKRKKWHIEEQREQEILKLAERLGGKLTASELAMHTKISLRMAEQELSDLQEKGYVLLQHADNGAIIYNFHELLSAQQKSQARNLLD